MKKFLVLLLALMMVFTTFTACGNNDEAGNDDGVQQEQQQPENGDADADTDADADVDGDADADTDTDEEQTPVEDEKNEDKEENKPAEDKKEDNKKPTEDKKEDNKKPADKNDNAASKVTATELFSKVWAAYGEDQKFSAGYMDADGNITDGPAKFDASDADALDATLGVPADKAGSIKSASAMLHMMNANTFTGGAYQLGNASDAKALSSAIKENLANRQWMCGFPEMLITIQVEDNYLISAFGAADLIETFKANVTKTYGSAKVLVEEPLEF